jgi:predicted metalloprotease with PDZ domain
MKIFRLSLLLLLSATSSAGQEQLNYRVEYSIARPGKVLVVIEASPAKNGITTLIIPRAIPGGYTQQFYDRYVENVKATSSGGFALKVIREEGSRWRIDASDKNVSRIEYEVDLSRQEREIRSAADASRARTDYVGLLGYSVFGYLEGAENFPIRIEVKAPEGWPIFSTLSPKSPADKSHTTAAAKNFYALADSQIILGPKAQVRKLDAPRPLFLVYYSEVESDSNKHAELLVDAFRKVLDYFVDVPFEHYTGYIEILKPLSDAHEYGFSMEHLDSSTYFLGTDRAITSKSTEQQIERDRLNFVHHISHSWIPKQVYGTGYLPFNWELAPQIETIWFNEGFARYVMIEALADALPGPEGRALRQRQLESYKQVVARMPEFIRSMSLTELSRIGSMLYSEDFRTGRTLFSKGALMAAEIDQKIRERSKGKYRLRDSLRALVKWGQTSGRAFQMEELPGLLAKPVEVDEREIRGIMQRWIAGKH